MLIRKRLDENEFSNSDLRYNAGCDCVQFTPDGGTTWIDQPANDPRSSDAYRLPPLTGSDIRCRAAEGMTALIRQFVNTRLEDIAEGEMVGVILGFIAFIPGFNVLYALLIAFVALAFTIAREVLEDAFTEAVYGEIRCIFYRTIGADGQMSQSQFDEAYAALADLDTIAQVWCENVMALVGAVGMSNAGVALEAAADCDDCGWCYYLGDLATLGVVNLVPSNTTCTATFPGDGGVAGCDGSANSKYIVANIVLPASANVTKVTVQWSATKTRSGTIWDEMYLMAYDTTTVLQTKNTQLATGTVSEVQTVFEINMTGDEIFTLYQYTRQTGTTGQLYWNSIKFEGTGDNPFSSNNC